jgi:hypothetical protein
MMGRFLALVIFALFSIAQADAANDAAGATCLQGCRTNLKKAGLWSSYPYGYCRNKCGYWVGAEKDKRQ